MRVAATLIFFLGLSLQNEIVFIYDLFPYSVVCDKHSGVDGQMNFGVPWA
jgi:hypothetical protein